MWSPMTNVSRSHTFLARPCFDVMVLLIELTNYAEKLLRKDVGKLARPLADRFFSIVFILHVSTTMLLLFTSM